MPTTLAFSNYAEDAVLDHLLRNTALASPVTVYVALYTADPGETDAGTEVTGGSYARQAVTFGAPASGVCLNSVAVNFPTATASWGTVGWMQIKDAVTAGNALFPGAVEAAVLISIGDTPRFQIGDLSITLD